MDKPIQSEEKVVEEFYEELAGRRWPLLLGAVLVSVALGVAVVFGGRAIYRHYNNSTVAIKPAKTTHSVASTASGAAKTATKSSAVSKTTTATSTTTKTATNTSLPNSGPGQVFELFTFTSLGAAVLHFVITNKRAGLSSN